jgi:drug/metabolite transporter (DMT)-like permease
VFTKLILASVPAKSWVLFRISGAMIVLLPLAMWLRTKRSLPGLRSWLLLGIASLFGVTLNQILFTEGMVRTTPEHSAVVNSCIPMWTLMVAVIAGQERLNARRVIAMLSALCGVLYLLGLDEMIASKQGGFSSATLSGDLLSAANGIVFAIHLVMMRKIGRDIDPWTTTAILFFQGALMIALWSGPNIKAADVTAVTMPPILWFAIYTILASTVLTYLLNTWALRHTHSSNVALYINVQPIVAATLNCALGAPAPDHRFYVALGLVAFGLWLQTRTRSNQNN